MGESVDMLNAADVVRKMDTVSVCKNTDWKKLDSDISGYINTYANIVKIGREHKEFDKTARLLANSNICAALHILSMKYAGFDMKFNYGLRKIDNVQVSSEDIRVIIGYICESGDKYSMDTHYRRITSVSENAYNKISADIDGVISGIIEEIDSRSCGYTNDANDGFNEEYVDDSDLADIGLEIGNEDGMQHGFQRHCVDTENDIDKESDDASVNIKAAIDDSYVGIILTSLDSTIKTMTYIFGDSVETGNTHGIFVGNSKVANNSFELRVVNEHITNGKREDYATGYKIVHGLGLDSTEDSLCSRENKVDTDLLSADLVSGGNARWSGLLLMLQYPYFSLSTGNYSISKWKKQNNDNEKLCNTVRISKKNGLQSYISYLLVNVVEDALIMSGVNTIEDVMNVSNVESVVMQLCDRINMYKLNNIVVNNGMQRNGKIITKIQLTIRSDSIANSVEYAAEKIRRQFQGNSSGSCDVNITPVNERGATGTYEIDIQPTGKVKSPWVFFGSVLDSVTEREELSLTNAIMGQSRREIYKKLGGVPASNAFEYCFCLYAGSGSGKGNMTQTIVSQALCDATMLFYVDGKPETGAAFASYAWKQHREAFMFSGSVIGRKHPYSGHLADFTNGMRQADEIKGDFASVSEKAIAAIGGSANEDRYVGYMNYLRCVQLFCNMVNARANGKADKKRWAMWVFDEIQQMAFDEQEILNAMARYSSEIDSKNKASDEGIQFIKQFNKLRDAIETEINNAVTISMRGANMTTIFIFQSPSWINEHPKCLFARMVATMGKNSRKIVGNAAFEPRCQFFGDDSLELKNKTWFKKLTNDPQLWGFSDASDIRKDDNVSLFQPYSIFCTPCEDGGNGPLIPYPTNDGNEYMYLEYVLDKLGSHFKDRIAEKMGIQAHDKIIADVLGSAYDYVEDNLEVFAGSQYSSLKEFIYNLSNLTMETTKSEVRRMADGEINSVNNGFNVVDFSEIEGKRTNEDMYMDSGSSDDASFNENDFYAEDGFGFGGEIEWNDNTSDYNTVDDDTVAYSNIEPEMYSDNTEHKQFDINDNLYNVSSSTGYGSNKSVEDVNISHSDKNNDTGNGAMTTDDLIAVLDSNVSDKDKIRFMREVFRPIAQSSRKPQFVMENGVCTIDTKNNNTQQIKLSYDVEKGNVMSAVKAVFRSMEWRNANKSPRKFEKYMRKGWKAILNSICKSAGGAGKIKVLDIKGNMIVANGRFTEHGLFEAEELDSLCSTIDFRATFKKLFALNRITMDEDMFNEMEAQYHNELFSSKLNDEIVEATDFAFMACPMLNKIILLNRDGMAYTERTRKELIERTDNKKIREIRERRKAEEAVEKAMETSRKARGINKVKRNDVYKKKNIAVNAVSVAGSKAAGLFRGIIKLIRPNAQKYN